MIAAVNDDAEFLVAGEPEEPDTEAAQVVDRTRLLRPLGRGGVGEV